MKEVSIQELKDIQLGIALEIDRFCRENGIRYSLAYGNLIGAVRHGGFIPWDDDVDIVMPRPDYERFIRSFSGLNLEVMAPELDPSFYAPYANVYDSRTLLEEENHSHGSHSVGVKVDIFPIDGAPSDDESYAQLRKKTDRLKVMLFYKNVRLGPRWKSDKILWFKTLVWKLAILPLSVPSIQSRIRALATANDFAASEMVDMVVFPDPGDTRVKREIFEHYVELDFEGHTFLATRDYDSYLRTLFGDYMTLPPESERVPHHRFQAWWK